MQSPARGFSFSLYQQPHYPTLAALSHGPLGHIAMDSCGELKACLDAAIAAGELDRPDSTSALLSAPERWAFACEWHTLSRPSPAGCPEGDSVPRVPKQLEWPLPPIPRSDGVTMSFFFALFYFLFLACCATGSQVSELSRGTRFHLAARL